ncbi:MAG TPA: hypothetical protein VFK45_09220 [Gammaproteobacteria bacterium]|nr:hypothetical protein [Gammaproteobacteria bacterium]
MAKPDNEKGRPDLAQRLNRAFEACNDRSLVRRVAEACNVSEQAVGRWRRTGQVRIDHLLPIAKTVGVSLMWLLSGDGFMASPASEPQAGMAPLIGDTVVGVDPQRIGAQPRDGDPYVIAAGMCGFSCYAVRVIGAPELAPRYREGEVALVALADSGTTLVPGTDMFVQRNTAQGVSATLCSLAWEARGEVALDPVVPSEMGRGRRVYPLDELALCHPVMGIFPPGALR